MERSFLERSEQVRSEASVRKSRKPYAARGALKSAARARAKTETIESFIVTQMMRAVRTLGSLY